MYRLVWILTGMLLFNMAWADRERDWSKVINEATDSIVTIRVDAVRAFDTARNSSSQATGFVVDAKRGIILTNRHVVQSGPVTAVALFANREEIELKPIYRDPVHDFGFFQYNPEELKFIKPKSLPLKPKEAVVGREIRVVGNDAGEQLSILAGTLARTDRQAPYYGRGRYNDFNTFYYQSASGVSGGSSGSPVLDIHGNVIALNAGGSVKASSSFFLPLQRMKRALKLIQKNQPISRGTLQTTFDYKPYDEVRRLGLRPKLEASLRKVNHGVGLLVVRRSLPETAAHELLKPGDILIKGSRRNAKLKWLRRFEELEALLDENVNQEINLLVERDGHGVEVVITVDDLHALTPDRYLTFGQAIVHNLSYQQARHLNRPVEGVYVAQSGYLLSTAGVPRGAVILAIDNKPVKNIDDVENILNALADRQQAALQYITFKETRRTQVSIMRMDRRWFELKKCYRDDQLGIWPCDKLAENKAKANKENAQVKFIEYKDVRANKLSSAIVSVQFDIPYNINGVEESHYTGAGLIINKKNGLVLVDRNTVPVNLGDVRVVFAGALDVSAKVIFIHPLHNMAIVQYDPKILGDTPVNEIEFSDKELNAGDKVWLIALKNGQELLVEETKVSAVESLDFSMPKIPTFRESNLDVISLHNPTASRGGVLSDEDGKVLAVWSSFAYGSGENLKQYEWGVPAEVVEEIVEQWRCCKKFSIRSLEVELATLSIAQSRKLGLSDKWIKRFQTADAKRQVLAVSRRVAGSDAERQLQEGDLILAVDGEIVRNYRDVEKAIQKAEVTLSLNRLGTELEITVKTKLMDGSGTLSVVQWAGALIQAPHRELSLQRGIKPKGVYVSYVFHGSPANRSNLSALLRIVEFNGESVENLEQFKALTKKYKNEKFIQLKVLDLINRESVISLRQNTYYWPGREIVKLNGEWGSR
jgi:pro-apoptotic serine protease NMA111